MQHHHLLSDRTPESDLQVGPRSPSETLAQADLDAQIEDYLDSVVARLVPSVPYDERRTRRESMRARIRQTIAAHIELGSTREESIVLALAQIQREESIPSSAVRAVSHSRTHERSAQTATVIALGFFGLFYLLDQTRVSGHLWNHWFGPLYAADGTTVLKNQAVTNFYRFELIVLPLICGLSTGLLSRARSVRGTLNALAILALPAILWGGLAYGLSYADLLWANQWPEWVKNCFPNPVPAVSGIAFWSALGALSAGAGGWLRRGLPRARTVARSLRNRRRRDRPQALRGIQNRYDAVSAS